MTQEDTTQVTRTIININFPELARKRIRYRFVSGKQHNYYMAIRWMILEYQVFIDKEILQFSQGAFTGCLAHEFAHILIDSKKSFFRRVWELFNPPKEETAEERCADRVVVERGLGKELLAFNEEHCEKYKSYKATEGLTKHEIRKLLKK